jgi:redox-sensitive bicupin YhaK (pirin superfamily)
MITLYPYDELGTAELSWLKTKYHFSFYKYHNPERMGFGVLRVINDDLVSSQSGFDMHPHRDMEIITYVRSGAITHRDSNGNEGRTAAGDVQVMSAGTGIFHSEHNLENEATSLYQIWIKPKVKGVNPSWSSAKFPKECNTDRLPLLVSGNKEDDALHINQDAFLYGGRIAKGSTIEHKVHNQLYILVSEGAVAVDGALVRQGDGCEVTSQKSVSIKALSGSEVVVIDVPHS